MTSADTFVAIVLGLVEGLTEFLPISSTGHLILAGSLLGFDGARASTFEVVIQLGAILAIVVLYRDRLLGLWPGRVAAGFAGARGLGLLAVTSIPSLALGLVAHDFIKERLFTPSTVIWALAVGGVAIIAVERLYSEHRPGDLDTLTWKQALAIGAFQCLALWPGMSRSAATIIGGVLVGLGRRGAIEYSFLAALPVMLAATTFDLYKAREILGAADLPFFGVGFVVAFLSAIVAVRMFVRLVSTRTLVPFAYYRIALALLVFFFIAR